MHRALTLSVVLAAGLLASAAVSQPARPPSRFPPYLASPVPVSDLVGPPPAAGSPAEAADRRAFQATRALAGTRRWERAIEDAKLTEPGALRSWSCAAGIEIDEAATPATYRLLRRTLADAGAAPGVAKEVYKRPRPLVGNDAPICVERGPIGRSASYPSGHASAGWAWALVLAELRPDRIKELIERGATFGDSRVVCGVHYPSDVQAGRLSGAAVVARLHTDAAFLNDMGAARAELATAKPATICAADEAMAPLSFDQAGRGSARAP